MTTNNFHSFYYFLSQSILISPGTIQFYSTVNNVLNKLNKFATQCFFTDYLKHKHCGKSFGIRSYFVPYFPAFESPSAEKYGHFSRNENRK